MEDEPEAQSTPFIFSSDGVDYEHERGDAICSAGWCGRSYPQPCEQPGCPGLVHANFGDENRHGDYWLYTQCDTCGESE